MEPTEIRLRQLSRIYGTPLDADAARDAVQRDPVLLARALFEEAASSDDVTGLEDATGYFDARVGFFGDLLPAELLPQLRDGFTARWKAWEQV
jgi:hypothetical protein